jgi:hypothetical protein
LVKGYKLQKVVITIIFVIFGRTGSPELPVERTSFSDGRNVDGLVAGAVHVVAASGEVEAEVLLRSEAILGK